MTLKPDYTGDDGQFKIGSKTFPISNITIDVEANTTDVQHNDSLKPDHVVTGMRYSGSFEFEGKNEELFNQVWQFGGGGAIARPTTGTISYREKETGELERNFVVEQVKITSASRDVPSDDVGSTSFDFVAENIRLVSG